MPTYYHNEILFSEIYLEEITRQAENADVLASLKVLGEYREYADTHNLRAWKESYVHEVLSALGFFAQSKSDHLTHLFSMGSVGKENPLSLCYVILPEENLDNTTIGRNWAEKIIRALREKNLQWGLLTNGKQWRIYHQDEPTPYETYLEIDLEAILVDKAKEAYQIFHKFMKAENFFVQDDGKCQFDRFKKESQDKIDYIEKELANALKQREEGGKGVLSDLCMGYVEELRRRKEGNLDDEGVRKKIYHGAMLYMFRLLFLFYADARGLLSDENHDLLSKVESECRTRHDGDNLNTPDFQIWDSLERIFVDIDQTYNGGLFSPQESEFTRFLSDTRIGDAYLANVIFNLTTYREKNGQEKPISYRDMSVRHLGTLYEGLLEHKLFIAAEDTEVKVTKGKIQFIPVSQGGKLVIGHYIKAGEVYFAGDPSERKSSGSYFTPEDVVNYIVSNTVGEKLKDLKSKFLTEQKSALDAFVNAVDDEERHALNILIEDNATSFVREKVLNLSVLDPAMGSGHFLVNAANLISNFITEILNDTDTKGTLDSGTGFWRRWVVENCIYGVDLNPLAVELAKLSLWILSMAKNKPLSFLKHHLKCGNSLVGAELDDIGNYPFSTNKKEALQLSLFERDPDFRSAIEEVISKSKMIASHSSTVRYDVEEKEAWLNEIEQALSGYKAICNVHTELFFNSSVVDQDLYSTLVDKKDFNLAYQLEGNNEYFHWQLEFPMVLLYKDGFDCVIGNPPYVRSTANKIQKKRFDTSNSPNLYAWFIELSFILSNEKSRLGMIVPLSLMISSQMESVRRLFLINKGEFKFANFDNIPDCIFNAGKESENTNKANSQRTTLFIINRNYKERRIESTDLLRWQSDERELLFQKLSFADITSVTRKEHFPMIGDQILVEFLRKMQQSKLAIKNIVAVKDADKALTLFVPTRARYFIPASPEDFHRNNQMALQFSSKDLFDYAFILISSNVFYWYWRAFGDGFDVAPRDIYDFPIPIELTQNEEIHALAANLYSVIPECRVFKLNGGKLIPNINFNKRLDVLQQIDRWICNVLGFENELNVDIFARKKSNSFMSYYETETDEVEEEE